MWVGGQDFKKIESLAITINSFVCEGLHSVTGIRQYNIITSFIIHYSRLYLYTCEGICNNSRKALATSAYTLKGLVKLQLGLLAIVNNAIVNKVQQHTYTNQILGDSQYNLFAIRFFFFFFFLWWGWGTLTITLLHNNSGYVFLAHSR